ncbi:Zn-dependent protease with chaperone function [Leptothrix ochracea L12]|uniref:Zn-dependent protease with chaperone function n=1 Tax=Leptothrix ochracea L12 TaxID=735332 RepID=I4Z581_9BURK|nr:M48 family metallopeptidase [Leptothrix ochracea]EIM31373.1 Zn-dependent protease with chaperone function [Leptothrix ochracea L12]
MSALFFTLAFAVALATVLVLRMMLVTRQIRHVAKHRGAVPPDFVGAVSLAAHQKAADYTIARQRFDLLTAAWSAMVLVGWTLLGGLDALNVSLREVLQPRWGELAYEVGLIAAVSAIGGLLDLPFEAWRTFKLEQRFGFNRSTPALWWRDQLVQSLVGMVIGLPLAALVLWLMASMGALWWLWAFAALAAFILLMQGLYPTVIAPLFNKFTPLDDPELKRRVEGLMQRCGFRAQGFYVMDGSRRSAHANAYFTGFGPVKRVVFFDTLLKRLTPSEVEAVLAHELGHFHHRHVQQRMVTMLGLWLGTLALIGWLMDQPNFYLGLGVVPNMVAPNHAVALLLMMMVGPVFSFLLGPLMSAASRRHEYQADAYAGQQSNRGDLASALVKLFDDNASTLTPDPLYVRFYYSHPPASERLAALGLRR